MNSSSTSPPRPRLSLRSPELQQEFLQECRNRFRSHSDADGSSVFSSAAFSPAPSLGPAPFPSFSPAPSPLSSSCVHSRTVRLSLSSPELLSELQDSKSRSLRHVHVPSGLTTVFSGRGRRGQVSGPAPSTCSANQKPSQ